MFHRLNMVVEILPVIEQTVKKVFGELCGVGKVAFEGNKQKVYFMSDEYFDTFFKKR